MAKRNPPKEVEQDPRRLSCEILDGLEAGGRAEIGSLVSHIRDERDARLATELIYGTLRHRSLLDHHIEQLSGRAMGQIQPALLSPLRLGLYQILKLDRIPASAAVNESVSLAKLRSGSRAAGFVNAILRSACKLDPQRLLLPESANPLSKLSLQFSMPAWLVTRWAERLGESETRALLEVFSRPAPLTLWFAPGRGDPDRIVRELSEDGVECSPSPLLPNALRVRRGRPQKSRPFHAGEIYIQDEASQVIPALMGAKGGETLVDLCAAPGGKAFLLALGVGEEGRVLAFDKDLLRLRILAQNLRRLDFPRVWPVMADLLEAAPVKGQVDGVLVDAPCTGTGILGRHPEIRWRRKLSDFRSLTRRQSALLDTAAGLLESEGRLVYSVCSLEPEEGEERIERFLAQHPEFLVENVQDYLPHGWSGAVTEEGYFRSWPHRQGTDGFFAARLRRR